MSKIIEITVAFLIKVPDDCPIENISLGLNLSDIEVRTDNMKLIRCFVVSHVTLKVEEIGDS